MRNQSSPKCPELGPGRLAPLWWEQLFCSLAQWILQAQRRFFALPIGLFKWRWVRCLSLSSFWSWGGENILSLPDSSLVYVQLPQGRNLYLFVLFTLLLASWCSRKRFIKDWGLQIFSFRSNSQICYLEHLNIHCQPQIFKNHDPRSPKNNEEYEIQKWLSSASLVLRE